MGEGGWGGHSTKFYTGSLPHMVRALTLSDIPFLTEKDPLSFDKWYPFSYLV